MRSTTLFSQTGNPRNESYKPLVNIDLSAMDTMQGRVLWHLMQNTNPSIRWLFANIDYQVSLANNPQQLMTVKLNADLDKTKICPVIDPLHMDANQAWLFCQLIEEHRNVSNFETKTYYPIHSFNPRQIQYVSLSVAVVNQINILDVTKPFSQLEFDFLKYIINQYTNDNKTILFSQFPYVVPIDGQLKIIQLQHSLVRYKTKNGEYRYFVDSENSLGKGAFGTVNKASGKLKCNESNFEFVKDEPSRKQHVIKHINNKNAVAEAFREVEILSVFSNTFHAKGPGIDALNHESAIVMRYITGISLDKLITNINLTVYQLAVLSKQLFLALEKVHEKNIVHRDLKPENIIVLLDSRDNIIDVTIIDYGLSKHENEMNITEKTGTPLYASFESLNKQETTKYSDYAAMARILWRVWGSQELDTVKNRCDLYDYFDLSTIPGLFKDVTIRDINKLEKQYIIAIEALLVKYNQSDKTKRPDAKPAIALFSEIQRNLEILEIKNLQQPQATLQFPIDFELTSGETRFFLYNEMRQAHEKEKLETSEARAELIQSIRLGI